MSWRNLLKWARITNPGGDASDVPIQQIDYHGKLGNSLALHDYGFHSVPIGDSYCLVLVPNGNQEERVHIATSMTKRPKGELGEVFLFHPETGSQVKMAANGDIEITAVGEVNVVSPTKITTTAPEIEETGDLTVDGDTIATGDVSVGGDTKLDGALNHDGTTAGFFGNTPVTRPVVTGIKQGGTAQISLFAALDSLGIIDDQT